MPPEQTPTQTSGGSQVPVPLTFGERAVGLTFNPSNDKNVQIVKELYAKIIDGLNDLRRGDGETPITSEQVRLFSVAITEAQTAQMWAVKAITYKY